MILSPSQIRKSSYDVDDDRASIASWSTWESDFVEGELGVTVGRAMRWFGELVIRPFDNRGARRELGRILSFLEGLDDLGWLRFRENRDAAEKYAVRLMDPIRCDRLVEKTRKSQRRCDPVYPHHIHRLGQSIILLLIFIGHVSFSEVKPDISFPSKTQFQNSIADLAAYCLGYAPKRILLHLLSNNLDSITSSEFVLELQHQLSLSPEDEGHFCIVMERAIRLSVNPEETAFFTITSSLGYNSTTNELMRQVIKAGASRVVERMELPEDAKSISEFLSRPFLYEWSISEKSLIPQIATLITDILLCRDKAAETSTLTALTRYWLPSESSQRPPAVTRLLDEAQQLLELEPFSKLYAVLKDRGQDGCEPHT